MADFFIDTKFHLCQLTPNTIRIVLGVAGLNRRFDLTLGLKEIKYCYNFSLVDDKWNLRAKATSPSIIKGLASSHKGMHNKIVIITGNVDPDPVNKRVPRQFSFPSLRYVHCKVDFIYRTFLFNCTFVL